MRTLTPSWNALALSRLILTSLHGYLYHVNQVCIRLCSKPKGGDCYCLFLWKIYHVLWMIFETKPVTTARQG